MNAPRSGSDGLELEIAAFFDEFADASTNEDWTSYGDLFLPAFLSIDPSSAAPVAREDLIAFLPQRKGIFDMAGATGTTLASLDVLALDGRHAIAETRWSIQYVAGRAPATPVFLHSTFVLRLEDRWRIAVYLNHNNLMELLGLAPAS
jgi:hypothetical protein